MESGTGLASASACVASACVVSCLAYGRAFGSGNALQQNFDPRLNSPDSPRHFYHHQRNQSFHGLILNPVHRFGSPKRQ